MPMLAAGTVKPFEDGKMGRNTGLEWEKWRINFELFLEINNVSDAITKRRMLLFLGGERIQEIVGNMPDVEVEPVLGPRPDGYGDHYHMAIGWLNEYFLPKRSTTYEKHIFRGMRQEEGEKMGDFIMRLRHQAAFCEFGSQADENIKDQIIEKCNSVALRRRILERGDLTLSEVETLATAFEAVEEQDKAFRGQNEKSAYSLSTK